MANTNVNPKLERFIDELLDDKVFETRGELARAIGMTDSGFSRAVRDDGALSIESCLQLAMAVKEHPADILRMAGRESLAKILDELCRGREFQLTRREREHVRLWRTISSAERIAMDIMLSVSARRARFGGGASGGGRPSIKRMKRS